MMITMCVRWNDSTKTTLIAIAELVEFHTWLHQQALDFGKVLVAIIKKDSASDDDKVRSA